MRIKLYRGIIAAIAMMTILAFIGWERESGSNLPGTSHHIIRLKGDHYQIGYQHGSLLQKEISISLEKWRSLIEQRWNLDPDEATDQFLNTSGYYSYIVSEAPEILEEVRGIADGSGYPFNIILAFQMSEEFELFGDDLFDNKCTTIAKSANCNQATIIAQNMDPPQFLHGYPLILHIDNSISGIKSFVFTCPGLIGLNGMNSQGVAIACNGISMLNSDNEGLPVAFIVRKVLQMSSLDEIDAFINKAIHASPQCYTIGDRRNAVCYECSANKCSVYETFKEEEIILHTNFSIMNRDFNQGFIDLLAQYGKTPEDPYYCPRFFLLYDLIADNRFIVDVDFLKTTLRLKVPEEHPVYNEFTYGTSIMILSENPVMYFLPGQDTDESFVKLSFNDINYERP